MKVSKLMTKEVISVGPEDTLLHAASVMSKNKLSGLPVVERDNGRLAGIVTQFDLMKKWMGIHVPSFVSALAQGESEDESQEMSQFAEVLIRDVMTKEVVTIDEDVDVTQAAKILITKDINPLPVLDAKGKLTGIISRSDIVEVVDKLIKK